MNEELESQPWERPWILRESRSGQHFFTTGQSSELKCPWGGSRERAAASGKGRVILGLILSLVRGIKFLSKMRAKLRSISEVTNT